MISQAKFDLNSGSVENMAYIMDSKAAIKQLSHKSIDDKLRYHITKDHLSVEIKNLEDIKGKTTPRFSNLSDGSIITLFDKTPPPKGPNDVFCPHFVELKWANGCNFDCAWCYLNGTLRFRPMGKKPYLKNKTKIITHIRDFLEQTQPPSLLNSGELSDSLVFENNGSALSKIIIPLFKEQKRHKLLILTKSVNVQGILASKSQDQVIVSFSLNSFEVAKRWEKKAPSPGFRIKAAKRLYDAGYTVRLRIDPIVPIDNWEQEYKELIDYIFTNLTPDRITLGSLRGLQSTINFSKDISWVNYLDDSSNWGKKVSFEKRSTMYKTIIDYLKQRYKFREIGLCKETLEMWNKLNMDFKNIKCNCVF